MSQQWERVEPVLPCDSPDGHDYNDVYDGSSHIPVGSICGRCSRWWTIVVLPRDTP